MAAKQQTKPLTREQKAQQGAAEISILRFDEMASELADLKETIENIEAEAAPHKKKFELIKSRMLDLMKELDRKSHKTSRVKLERREQWRVKMPESPEAKEEFFNFLKSRDLFEDYATVPSPALNSFFKDEMSQAKKDGNFDFKIPGIGEPTVSEFLVVKKG